MSGSNIREAMLKVAQWDRRPDEGPPADALAVSRGAWT